MRTLEAPCLTLYHDDEYRERDWDVEVCIPTAEAAPETERVKMHTLPRVEMMACTIHQGAFVTINEAYQALGSWIDLNGYRICGAAREVVPARGQVNYWRRKPGGCEYRHRGAVSSGEGVDAWGTAKMIVTEEDHALAVLLHFLEGRS